LADLKSNIKYILKKHHWGKEKAITIRNLCIELLPIRTNDREIRLIIRELNMEGIPILTSIHPPLGVYYGASSEEVNEYLANLGARMKAILDRMAAVNKIKAREFLKGQMEMFE
jgi:hypothetical protein